MTTTDLLAKLMAFQPVTAQVGRVNEAVEFLADHLCAQGVRVEVHSMGDRKCMYARVGPDRAPDLLFNAHLDVVPADADQFALREVDGWLVGRGTHDCLGNCALLTRVLCRLAGMHEPPAVGVAFSTDEETGGESTAFLGGRIPAPRRLVVVMDGSGNSVIVAQKGVLTLRLLAQGTACHSATPWEGDNAIDRLIDGYRAVRAQFPEVRPPDDWRSTMAATVIRGGSVHNRVPDTAELTLNIRLTESEDRDEMLQRIRTVSGLDVAVDMACDPVFCDPGHPEIQALVERMRSVLGRDIAIKRSNGATDARHFTRFQVPVAIIGVHGRDLHGAHEALDAQSLHDYEELVVNLCHCM